jgi:hypothetical protein
MFLRLGNAGLPLRTAKDEPKINGLYNIAAGVRSQVRAKTNAAAAVPSVIDGGLAAQPCWPG